ncbi:MAG: nucleoid-associated protein [Bacteroidales bacterium]|nr:nucleoid-associated protein [Bacteroidales bacterium]
MKFTFEESVLDRLIIHKVGNKAAEENYYLAREETTTDDELKDLLTHYFLSAFKSEELYHFYHDSNLDLNEVYSFVSGIFNDPESLPENSVSLAKYLYNQSVHPQIKGGEFYVVYFKDCTYDGETMDAVGLFKSENKVTYLAVEQGKDGFDIEQREGININKLDKGCVIFNTEKQNGYIITIVDNTNKGYEAQYWKDDFLNVLIINNEFQQTNQFLGIAKRFVTEKLPDTFEVTKADQIDMLNRSVQYFKTHEQFEKNDFEKEVFQDNNVIDSFRDFDSSFRMDNEVELSDRFDISPQAVKKQARVFKSVLKLDRNFHIYIHGNRNLIEQGIDENGRKFYKIYYKEES